VAASALTPDLHQARTESLSAVLPVRQLAGSPPKDERYRMRAVFLTLSSRRASGVIQGET